MNSSLYFVGIVIILPASILRSKQSWTQPKLQQTLDLTRNDPDQYRSDLKLARTLAALNQKDGIQIEHAVRDALESIDRTDTNNLPARLGGILRARHNIQPEDVTGDASKRDTGRLLAGLIERAPANTDQEMHAALSDREHAILVRAEHLVDEAIRRQAPWLVELGEPLPGAMEEWRRRAVTVACYRDLYGVDSETALGKATQMAKNRTRDRVFVAAALRTARPDTQRTPVHETSHQPPALDQAPTLGRPSVSAPAQVL